jgi:tetratricopeptide (TPR) repeat protein
MSTSTESKRRTAERLFNAAFSLYQECRYEQSLIELRRAEDAFRKLDSQGHPFNHVLPNGVTGLANTLALSGRCHQRLGNIEQAVICYETSFINAKFERPRPFTTFVKDLREDLLDCYADDLRNMDESSLVNLTQQDMRIDASCCFPFSLTKEAFTLARVYELAPERYPHLRDFVVRAAEQDAAIRRSDKKSDESRIKRANIYIWLTLGSLWAAYCLLVAKALFLD